MLTGTVKVYSEEKGYGFIAPHAGGKDIFVHVNELKKSGLMALEKDQQVSFSEKSKDNKTFAADITIL
jgi:CspA family cold shock protein